MDAATNIYQQSQQLLHQDPEYSAITKHDAKLHVIIERMAHAIGRCDFISQIVARGDVAQAVYDAVNKGASVLCDSAMTQASIIKKPLTESSYPLCFIDSIKRANSKTRAAQAVLKWESYIKGSVVLIGQNPSSLRILIKKLKSGWKLPAAIIAVPVGYYDAQQSKQEFIDLNPSCCWLSLKGKIGGSSLAGSAFNACFKKLV